MINFIIKISVSFFVLLPLKFVEVIALCVSRVNSSILSPVFILSPPRLKIGTPKIVALPKPFCSILEELLILTNESTVYLIS